MEELQVLQLDGVATMLQRLNCWSSDTKGNVAVMFAIAAVPVLLAMGSGVDYLRYYNLRTDIQSAIDGAALAAALPASKTDAQRVAIAKDYFKKNLRDLPGGAPKLQVNLSADEVTISADTAVPTTFMRLGGIDKMMISETTQVMRPTAGSAEVVLVLDYSGSMDRKNKYQDMRDAATAMINNLDAAIPDDKLKIGLVPFSAMVYTSMNKAYVTQPSAVQSWTGCTQDRRHPFNRGVKTPTPADETKWGYVSDNGENAGSYDCSAYQNNNLKIIPLTTSLTSVKSKLGTMRPVGNTNIPLGTEFGWNLLDPDLPFDEALPYNSKFNRKFLVLLTDGVQTSEQWGTGNARSVANGNENLLTICEGVRESGITVFTIAYDITDPAVTTLLKSCAPGNYYEPDSGGGEIGQVFSAITREIKNQTVRISK